MSIGRPSPALNRVKGAPNSNRPQPTKKRVRGSTKFTGGYNFLDGYRFLSHDFRDIGNYL